MPNRLEEITNITQHIRFPGYALHVVTRGHVIWIEVTYLEPDVMSGVDELQTSRPWLIPDAYGPGQIVQVCFKAILTSMEHRLRENFTYKGKAVLMPHFDLEQLLAIAPTPHANAKPIPFGTRTGPDAYCYTTPDGECTSIDPRCMHFTEEVK